MMRVKVLFFAGLRDSFRQSEGDFEVQEGETVLQLTKRILSERLGENRFEASLLYAVNNEYVPRDYQLKEDDELALIPPVSGG